MDSSYCIKVQIQPLVHRYINIQINFLMLLMIPMKCKDMHFGFQLN
jgi:hypothetical protein